MGILQETGHLLKKWTAGIEFKNLVQYPKKLAKLIHHVEFRLHKSFDNPLVKVHDSSNGNYSINEKGYGSFPIMITVFLNTKDQAGHYQKFEVVHDLNIDAEGHTSSETISVLTNPTEELKKLLVRYNFDLKEMKDKKKKKKSKTNEELKNDAKKTAAPADSTSSKKQKNKTDEKLSEKQELKKEPRKSDAKKKKKKKPQKREAKKKKKKKKKS